MRQVAGEGQGNREAQQAIRALSQSDGSVLPLVLESMTGANPLAANWLRSAFESIAEREFKQGGPLPAQQFEGFVLDRTQNPQARRLAFEWLVKIDPAAHQRLIPSMLDDPNAEFRRDAVEHLIVIARDFQSANQTDRAIEAYRRALDGAVHDDQVKLVASELEKFGIKVDVQQHFGLLASWHVVGPFDNVDEQGLDEPYPPENGVDFDAIYPGREGQVHWTEYSTDDEYGIVDLSKILSPARGSCAYAVAEFTSSENRPVEFRLGTPNAWKLWVNGKLLFQRGEYHRGMALDQYRIDGELSRGTNVIMLKICQNEQTQEWAQRWEFQFRICDLSGAAIHPAVETASR